MRILFATSSFRNGGVTSYAKEVISCFSKDNDFHVMVGDDSFSPITEQGITIHRIECSDISIGNLRKAIDSINNEIKPDVIIGSKACIIPIISAYLNDDIRIITVSHSLRFIEADMAAMFNQHIDHVIALSQFNLEYLKHRFSLPESKISVIPNFVAELPDAEEILRKKTTEKHTPAIIFPGGTAGSKSPDIVLKAAMRLVKTDLDFKFYWLGNTISPSKKFPFLHIKDLSKFVNDKRFVFPGRLSRQQAAEIISMADLFLAPSRREGCPMALLEAMRCGCIPLVADYKVANKEIVTDHKNGFVISHNNIDEWVRRMTDIIQSPDKYKEIYFESKKRFEESFTFQSWFENINGLVQSCTQNHSTRSRKINPTSLRLRRFRFRIQQSWCKWEIFLIENIPTTISMLRIKIGL